MSGDHAADALLAQTPSWAADVIGRADGSGDDVRAALDIAVQVGAALPEPGAATATRWAVLAALARANVTVARVVEAHTDALAILAEAGSRDLLGSGSSQSVDRSPRTWGVFAAEGGSSPLRVEGSAPGMTISGVKPWCSLAADLDAALVTAHDGDARRLLAVDLRDTGVRPHPVAGWVSRGLPTVTSVGVTFDRVAAVPVGAPGWYLTRPGFAWGGMGVAACWYGAALGVADRLPDTDTDLLALHRGRVDIALHAAACVLVDAAARIDEGSADGEAGALLALRIRAVIADAAETVLREVGHATGPAPLAFDEAHAARVADLTVYLRQHHGERDLAALGHLLDASGSAPS